MLDQPNLGGAAVPPDATTQRLVLGLVLFHEDQIATLAEYLLRPVAQIEANVAVLVDAGLVFMDGEMVFASQAARRMGVLWPVRVQEPPETPASPVPSEGAQRLALGLLLISPTSIPSLAGYLTRSEHEARAVVDALAGAGLVEVEGDMVCATRVARRFDALAPHIPKPSTPAVLTVDARAAARVQREVLIRIDIMREAAQLSREEDGAGERRAQLAEFRSIQAQLDADGDPIEVVASAACLADLIREAIYGAVSPCEDMLSRPADQSLDLDELGEHLADALRLVDVLAQIPVTSRDAR